MEREMEREMERVVYPERPAKPSLADVKKNDEFGLKEQDDIYRAFGIDPSFAKKVLSEKPDHAQDYLDSLIYTLKAQEEIKPLRKHMAEDYEKTKVVDEFAEIPPKPDMVNHPPHYNVNGFEVIDIIKAFTEGLNGIAAVDTGNAIKYILRWQHKNGVEDLKKARWYIDHLIKELEK